VRVAGCLTAAGLPSPQPFPSGRGSKSRALARQRNRLTDTRSRGSLARKAGFPYNRADTAADWRTGREGPVRTFLGVAVIAIGIINICLQHRWHRILGVVAIAVGLTLCALAWIA
jgi:hypothetical protein